MIRKVGIGALEGLSKAVVAVRPVARRWFPRALHHASGTAARRLIRAIEDARSPPLEDSLPPLPPPALTPEMFAAGPVLLINAALAAGGAERQIVLTLKALERRLERPVGLRCVALGEHVDYDFFRPALDGFAGTVANLPRPETAGRRLRSAGHGALIACTQARLGWMPADIRAMIVAMAAEFIRERPRIVHAWQDAVGLAAAHAALLVGVPRIVLATRNVNPSNFGYHRAFMRRAYRSLLDEPSVVLTNNSTSGALDYAAWLGCDATRFRVIRNGVDAAGFARAEASAVAAFRARLGVPPDAPLIGTLFRINAEKRPLLWVAAAAEIRHRVPTARFVAFGEGALAARMKAECRRLRLDDCLRLPGATGDAALALSSFDLLLCTSAFEGTPNTILEAGMLGLPVVATDAGGVAETIAEGITGHVVRDTSGVASDRRRAEHIAEAAVQALTDERWRQGVRTAAPRFIRQRFGLDRMIDEVLALYGLPEAAVRSGRAGTGPTMRQSVVAGSILSKTC